jgi:hypothetical protein
VAPTRSSNPPRLRIALRARAIASTRAAVALAAIGCGWLPPDSPPARPAPPDPDAEVLHDWKVAGHVLGPRALISDADAAGFHGRAVAISATGYSSPWSGHCDDVRRERRPRVLTELTAELALAPDRAADLGLVDPIVEYRVSCTTGRSPTLTCYVGGGHALTCWGGVCYLLTR